MLGGDVELRLVSPAGERRASSPGSPARRGVDRRRSARHGMRAGNGDGARRQPGGPAGRVKASTAPIRSMARSTTGAADAPRSRPWRSATALGRGWPIRILLARLGPQDRRRAQDRRRSRSKFAARSTREPDRGTRHLHPGPRLMVADGSLAATGLVQPGSLIYLHLPPEAAAGRATAADWLDDAARRVSRRPAGASASSDDAGARASQPSSTALTLYLTLVGLTALLVGGVGVGNAASGYLDGKTATIATLKCLGAPARADLPRLSAADPGPGRGGDRRRARPRRAAAAASPGRLASACCRSSARLGSIPRRCCWPPPSAC